MTDQQETMSQPEPTKGDSGSRTKPRKPWLAGLLAFFCQGLGHFYAGKGAVGIGLYAVPALVFIVILVVSVATDTAVFATVWILVAVAAVIWVGQIVWAVRVARRAGPDYQVRRYNHVLVYVAFFVGTSLVGESDLLSTFVLESFKIPAGSTIPAVEIGDQIFVAKLGSRNTSPQRGDLVVFECPIEPHEDYIKRVVGMPGEEIAIQGGVVSIDGQPIPRKEVGTEEFWDRDSRTGRWYPFEAVVYEETLGVVTVRALKDVEEMQTAPDFGPVEIPEGHYFMMGDNRDHSFDSRAWGPVSAENILGRAHTIWFSWGKNGFRSDRIGKRL